MKIIKAKDYNDMSRKAANIISAQVIMKPNAVLGLATGGTPVDTYKQLIEWYNKGDIDFSEVTTVNLDEYRGLPKTHEQSYWYFMHQHFLIMSMCRRIGFMYPMGQIPMRQRALGGKVPDVVPSCGVESTSCVWGDAACIIPWNLYLFYGDKSILEDQFDSMRAWVDYVRGVDGDHHGWRDVFHYGDWLALDNMNGDAEQVMGATDEEFIANLYYAVSAGLVADAAAVLGKKKDKETYRKLSDEQFTAVKREYYSATGRCCIKTQTALLLTLKYHLSENEELTKSNW